MTRRTLLVSSGDGPGECRLAVAHFLEHIQKRASRADLAIDISTRDAKHGPSSAIIVLSGPRAATLAAEIEGAIQWRSSSPLRPRHKRKNWFIEVFQLPPAPTIIHIPSEEVKMRSMRAGGPGGQHQNTTDSAIRASWQHSDGTLYSVAVRNDRSQHRNRQTALIRLQALVDADFSKAHNTRKGKMHLMHKRVHRGAPRLIFDGPDFKPLKQQR